MNILITGAAGFIGQAVALRLLTRGDTVVGVDSLNDYYDVALKKARLSMLTSHATFRFVHANIADRPAMADLFANNPFDVVVNLAAQAGVRYSIENPYAFIDANIHGFLNILEGCRHSKVGNLIFASSSSVYGANTTLPLAESHTVDHPVALYAATKKANELMAHSYASLYALPTTGLRFFTVYGPWGRPDMALFLFTKSILAGEAINVFNKGDMVRDYTYIDDIVEGITRIVDQPAAPDPMWSSDAPNPATSYAPYRLYNIGNSTPVTLINYIKAIENKLGKKAIVNLLPMQPGDVRATAADVTRLATDTGFRPNTSVDEGVAKFVDWYRAYYRV